MDEREIWAENARQADAYHARRRQMLPDGWGLPIAFALLALALIGWLVAPSIAATLADPLAGNPW
jgi:hypothetical protein